jgi:hypothetical protein
MKTGCGIRPIETIPADPFGPTGAEMEAWQSWLNALDLDSRERQGASKPNALRGFESHRLRT